MFSKFCTVSALCVAMLGVPAIAQRINVRIIPGGGGQAVLQASDLTYLGAFRVPSSGTDGSFSAGSIAGRVVSGDQHIFFLGNKNTYCSPALYEINVQDLVLDPTDTLAESPQAEFFGDWGQFDNGEDLKIDDSGTPTCGVNAPPQGLHYNAANGYIYMGYNIGYTSTARYTTIAKHLDNNVTFASTVCGPFAYEYASSDIGAPGTRTYMLSEHPTTGKMLGSSAYKSGDSGLPNGPSLIGGADWPTCPGGGTGASNILQPDVYLNYYFQTAAFSAYGVPILTVKAFQYNQLTYAFERTYQNSVRSDPAENGGYGTWTGAMDAQSQPVWIEGTNKHGLIVPAGIIAGNGTDENDCDSGTPLTDTAHGWYRTEGNVEIVLSSASGIGPGETVTGLTSGAVGTTTLTGLASPDTNLIYASQGVYTDFQAGETLTFSGGASGRTVTSFHRLSSCNHNCVPSSPGWSYSTGPSFNLQTPVLIFFDPDRLTTNAAGTTTDYTTPASSMVNVLEDWPEIVLTGPNNTFGGTYYNPDTKRLYLSANEDCFSAGNPFTCDFRQRSFYVFSVDDSAPPVPAFPAVPFAASAGLWALGSLRRRAA